MDTDHAPASLQIFKAGTHIAEDGRTLTFSEADVQQIADSYDPALHEAPIVVGHPTTDAPAYGWGKALSARNGVLFAEPQQVDADFAGMVNAGRFKKISASIFMPDTPGNPTPGKFYLRHIGFLGAQPPAVKGLKSAAFAEDGAGTACFAMPLSSLGWTLSDLFQRFRDWLIDTDGLETADQVIPQWQIRSIDEATRERPADGNTGEPALSYAEQPHAQTTRETNTMSDNNQAADFAEQKQQLDARASDLDARQRALDEREKQAKRADAAAFAEGLVKEGKLLPRNQAPIVELLLALPADSAPLNFAEGDSQVSKPAATVLREFLAGLPKAVDFSEKSRDEATGLPASFAAPPGVTVDAGRAETYAKAKAWQQQHPGASWTDAVAAVGG